MVITTILPFWPRHLWFQLMINLCAKEPWRLPFIVLLLTQSPLVHSDLGQLTAVERVRLSKLGLSGAVVGTLLKARK